MAESAEYLDPATGKFDLANLDKPLRFIQDVKVRPNNTRSWQGSTNCFPLQQRLEGNNKEQYNQFLSSFTKYQESASSKASAEEIKESKDALKAEVKALLAGHDDLLLEFESLTS